MTARSEDALSGKCCRTCDWFCQLAAASLQCCCGRSPLTGNEDPMRVCLYWIAKRKTAP